jgi:hypothetical protein
VTKDFGTKDEKKERKLNADLKKKVLKENFLGRGR